MKNLNKDLLISILIVVSSVPPHHTNAGPSSSKMLVGASVVVGAGLITTHSLHTRSIPAASMDLELPKAEDGVTTLFAHGFGADKEHGKAYVTIGAIPKRALSVFNFEDAPSDDVPNRSMRTYLAGTGDVKRLQEAIRSNREANPGKKLELYGVSRGASTILHYLATAPPEELAHIVRAIVESPFKNRTDIVRNLAGIMKTESRNTHWLVRPLLSGAASLVQGSTEVSPPPLPGGLVTVALPNTNLFDAYPGNVIHQIPPNIPIQFVCSEEDQLIPASSTEGMYTQLRNLGHTVHLLKLARGPHANIIHHSADNRERYLAALRAFRAQYSAA